MGAVLFEQVDAALHGVALRVDARLEGGRAATGGAPCVPVGLLVGLDGDGRGDSAAAQMGAVGARGVRLSTSDIGLRPCSPGLTITSLDQFKDFLKQDAEMFPDNVQTFNIFW